ncbi:MAG TPA: hypothetical protein VFV38_50695 [Ktedonobacteraceae bacterium]|nr:hypothetical protein [Ktedonobacteraceae bacterium]
MNENEYAHSPINDQNAENLIAACIHVCTAATALSHAVQERFYNHHFYYFQAGFLLPHRVLRAGGEVCYGGLNEETPLFLLVPVEIVEQRKRDCLLQIAHEHLGTDDYEQLITYCQQVEQEFSMGTHHPHPGFQAETLAYQVSYWLGLLKQRQVLPEASWTW